MTHSLHHWQMDLDDWLRQKANLTIVEAVIISAAAAMCLHWLVEFFRFMRSIG